LRTFCDFGSSIQPECPKSTYASSPGSISISTKRLWLILFEEAYIITMHRRVAPVEPALIL
jgi:hypothetical protein